MTLAVYQIYWFKNTQMRFVIQEQVLDPKTRLLLYKLVNTGILEAVNGCISTGKEACVFHANGGRFVFQHH